MAKSSLSSLEASRTPSVFLSYSHKDEVWKERLETHLKVLGDQGLLDTWDDRRIESGTDWFEEIQEAMARASVAILLISADFLGSEFIRGEEVPKLLERRAKERLLVIPVMVRACNWKRVPWLAKLQARPNDDKTLASLEAEGGDRCDAALAALTEEILTRIEKAMQVKNPIRDLESRERFDDFLDRVETICRLREPEAEIHRYPGIGDAGGYLRIVRRKGEIQDVYPVGVMEHGLSREGFQAFLAEIDAHYRKNDPGLISTLVYGGAAAPADLVAEARTRRVHLVSFVEHQGLIDFRTYLRNQTAKLATDPIYPPRLYVPQRMRTLSILGREEDESADALAQVREWLDSPHGRFLVLLGDFGTGKTFLLHELARRMGEDGGGLVPILLQMRSLEKGRSLDALLAQHFAQEAMEGFSPAKFRYMLEQGRIALLFDGFDELALRVTYSKAADHFATLLQAATGNAKVVLTSRRQHFLSESQVKTALAERVESLSGHRLAILQPFHWEQVHLFLVNFFEGDKQRAKARLDLIDRVKDLLGLSANPRLLGFIAELPEEQLVAASKGGEITAAKLYELLLTRWLEYEFDRVHPEGAQPGLSVEDRWQAVTVLAMRLWQKSDRFVSLSDLGEAAARVVQAVGPTAPDAELVAFQVGSGTLLVRDDEGNFAFLHQSILEWLVAKSAAEVLSRGESPDALGTREISPLMADFFGSLAGREQAVAWARDVLATPSGESAKKNALLVLERQKEAIREKLDLIGQDLRGRDYSGQDLSGADLSGADLTEARLVGTRLAAARLVQATLRDADLGTAILTGADLTKADLTGARLLGADLRGALLSGTRLRRARLLGTALDVRGLDSAEVFGTATDPSELVPQSGTTNGFAAVAWSPDGEFIAVAAGGVIRLWEAQSGREVRVFSGHQGSVASIALSPDGKALASGSNDKTIRLWDIASGRQIRVFTGHQGAITSVAFSPEGTALASGSNDKTVRLWQIDNGKEIRIFTGPRKGVRSVAFSPDGKNLAEGSDDKTVCLWRVDSGRRIRAFVGHQGLIRSVAFSPDGQVLASASDDKTIRLWQVGSRQELLTLYGHQSSVTSIVFSPNGLNLASGSNDKTVRLWNAYNEQAIFILDGHQKQIRSVVFSPDGKILASVSDDTILFWQVGNGSQIRAFSGYRGSVRSVAFSPDGKTLAGGSDNTIRLWQFDSGREIKAFSGHQKSVRSVAFSPDGKTIAGAANDNTVHLWQVDTGREIRSFTGHHDWVRSVAFSPDGESLASGSDDNTVRLWQIDSGREIGVFAGHQSWVRSVTFSPDGKIIASASDDNTVRLWRIFSGREIWTSGLPSSVWSVAFSPDGKSLASGFYGSMIRLWRVDSGSEIRTFSGHLNLVASIAFSPDGKSLASGSYDNTVRLWQVDSGQESKTLSGHLSPVSSVAFSADGRSLASGSYDGTIRLWNVADGRCLAILLSLPEGWVAYAPDGRYKFGGIPAGGFWHAANLCRFEIGELDEWVPGLRLADDASFFDLPPWKPEIRVPERIMQARAGKVDLP